MASAGPAQQASTAAANRGAKAPRAPLRGRVMVVDDEASVANFMRDLLQTWGLDVTVVSDGLQARALVGGDPRCVDLVITDQVMPKITGLELARELLAVRPALPILLYTGFSDGIDDDDISGAGIRAMLRKPVDPDELYRLLRAHLVAEAPQVRSPRE
jgi:CheY-like chemotaxis protein